MSPKPERKSTKDILAGTSLATRKDRGAALQRSAGLGSLDLSDLPEESSPYRVLPLNSISPDPSQPRKHFDESKLQGMAASIGARGVLQPILVAPNVRRDAETDWIIVAGERRWRASIIAGKETIPAIIRESDSQAEALEIQLVENASREGLLPMEEAHTIAALSNDLGVSQRDLAARLSMDQGDISRIIRLLDLPDLVHDLLDSGKLTKSHGFVLLGLPDGEAQKKMATKAAEGGWSVRKLDQQCSGMNHARRRTGPAADHLAAANAIGEALSARLGADVSAVPAKAGFTVRFATLDDARALLTALGVEGSLDHL